MGDIELIIDFYKNARRQGPGSRDETLRAFDLTGLSRKTHLNIADIGCGTGTQTFDLAGYTNADITAVDLFPQFLDKLNQQADSLGYRDRISTLQSSMDDLPFEEESFDLIWSEGAIYNMGFEAGIKSWKPFLKPGGYLCVSEITWITNSRPDGLEKFWQSEYPEIGRASEKISILEENGYSLSGYFYLDQESWINNYYDPIKERFESFLKTHDHSEMAKKIVTEYQNEIDQYLDNKQYYSYGFFVACKD